MGEKHHYPAVLPFGGVRALADLAKPFKFLKSGCRKMANMQSKKKKFSFLVNLDLHTIKIIKQDALQIQKS